MPRFRVGILAAAVFALAAAPAGAQVARVMGTVEDPAGKPVRGATITAENAQQSPSTFTASTNDKGRWAMLGLKRGVWTITVRAPGFEIARTAVQVETLKPNPSIDVRLLKGSLPSTPGPLAGISASDLQRRIDAAEALAAAGDADGAISAYRDLLSRVPALTSAYLRIGALYEEKGETASALEAYRQLQRLEPDNARAAAAVSRLTR